MRNNQNTVLITGGGSGIGLELAKIFLSNGNNVILVGRDEEKLHRASSSLNGVAYIVGDVTDESDVLAVVEKVKSEYPGLNVLINNAGTVNYYTLGEDAGAYSKASREIAVNFLAPIRLTELLLPLLKLNESSSIINISSIGAYAPGITLPTYSASKAALHSYSQILRLSLRSSSDVKVFEALPPLVDTEFTAGIDREKMSPVTVAEEIFSGFVNNEFEIRVGLTKQFYKIMLRSPDVAFKVRNGLMTYSEANNELGIE